MQIHGLNDFIKDINYFLKFCMDYKCMFFYKFVKEMYANC